MLERLIELSPAYDKRDDDPKKNYGIHGVNLRFVLKGKENAVQFVLFTNWQLPHVQKELLSKYHTPRDVELFLMPMPADLGYHSKEPMYDTQEPMTEDCEYTGGKCYYDGSSLCAERIYKILLEEGDEGVWRELENYYNDTFDCV